MSNALVVGSFDAKKGITYQGISHRGNAFRVLEEVSFSINNTPMIRLPQNEDILFKPGYTYELDRDTIILLTRVVAPNLEIIYEDHCPYDIALVAATESAVICTTSNTEDIPAGKGTFTTYVYVQNAVGTDSNITLRLYIDGVLESSSVTTAPGQANTNVIYEYALPNLVSAGASFTFTAESSGNSCTVLGTVQPSYIRVEKTQL